MRIYHLGTNNCIIVFIARSYILYSLFNARTYARGKTTDKTTKRNQQSKLTFYLSTIQKHFSIMALLYGSICLSDIPREMMKKVRCNDGKERVFLSISIVEKKEPQTFTDQQTGKARTFTHFVSCAPKQEERRQDVPKGYYILGDLQTYQPQITVQPTAEQIANSPSLADDPFTDEETGLPF